jgi:stage V sporulation protein K
MVFAGNPGTGKTTVARIIANLLKALGVLRKGHLVEADRSSLVAGYSGQTALKTKAVVNEALGGVLFVDEAYALVSGDRDAFGKEALDTLMKEMEDHRSDLVVIAAGYNDEMRDLLAANPGMESRFPTTLRFADYDARELMKIADSILRPQKLTLGEGASDLLEAHFASEIEQRAEGTKGSNGRGVRNPAGGGETSAGAAFGGDQTRQDAGGPHHAHRRGLRGGVRRSQRRRRRRGRRRRDSSCDAIPSVEGRDANTNEGREEKRD